MAAGHPLWRRPQRRGRRGAPATGGEDFPESSADPGATADLARAASLLARVAIARLSLLAHPHGGWSDFWLEPGCSTSWVTAYAASALADAADAPGVSGGQRAIADALVQSAADHLLATGRDGVWGWAPDLPPDADSTAWAVLVLLAAGRTVPARSWTYLERHLGPGGTTGDPSAGAWVDPMPEVTAAVLAALGLRPSTSAAASGAPPTRHLHAEAPVAADSHADLDERWARLLAAGPEWTSQAWQGPDHPTALVLDAWRRRGSAAGSLPAAAAEAGSAATPLPAVPGGVCAQADALWRTCLVGTPEPAAVWALLDAQLPGGGWAGDAQVSLPAQSGNQPERHAVDARGVFTTATVLHAAVAVLRALPATAADHVLEHLADHDAEHERDDVPRQAGADARTPAHPRDERWDAVIARVATAQGVHLESALGVFRALTRESLAAGSPWPSPQLSSLASGQPVELSAGGGPAVRFTCEVGDPRLPPSARLHSGLNAVQRTAQLLGMGEAWAGRRAQLLGVLADPALPVPDGCRFWLRAGVDLPANDPAVLKAYLSLHARDVDDWRSRLHQALRMLPPGGSVWPALACLRGAGWCHQVGIGELPSGQWGVTIYYQLDRWRPDLLAELVATCDLSITLAELTPDIPGVVRAAQRGGRRTGIALRVDPMTGDVTEVTTTIAMPAPLVGNPVLTDRVAAWLEQRGQDAGPLRATVAAVESDWVQADPLDRMLGRVTLSGGRRGSSATVYVRPRPALPVT